MALLPIARRGGRTPLRLTEEEPPPPPLDGTNSEWARGTWVVQQFADRAAFTSKTSQLNSVLALPGCQGFSMRLPYKAYKADPALLDDGKDLADAFGKKFSIRTMSARYLDASTLAAIPAEYKSTGVYQGSTITYPMPYNKSTGAAGNPVYEQRWRDEVVIPQAAWCRANDVRLLHLTWHGYAWAEVWHDYVLSGRSRTTPTIPPGPGYSWTAWLEGYRRVAAIGIDVAGEDLMVEFALSGFLGETPLVGGKALQVGDELVKLLQAEAGVPANTIKSEMFCVQGNGMGKVNGAPTRRAAYHAKQMWNGTANPDTGAEYNWPLLYDALRANGETYLEVYLDSWFRAVNMAALKSEAAAWATELGV